MAVRICPWFWFCGESISKMHFVGSNLSTDPKSSKCTYKISKNFRVEKNGEISRNLRFSLVFVPASESDTHHSWDSWTLNLGFRTSSSNSLIQRAKTLSDASHRSGSSSSNRTKVSHTAFAVWLSLAGIAGLEPANAGVKVLCLTDLAISHYFGEDAHTL